MNSNFDLQPEKNLESIIGNTYSAQKLMRRLGYKNWEEFRMGPILEAIMECMECSVLFYDDFIEKSIEYYDCTVEEKFLGDYHLTIQACFRIVMNCDPRKYKVQEAQRYFSRLCNVELDDYSEWKRNPAYFTSQKSCAKAERKKLFELAP